MPHPPIERDGFGEEAIDVYVGRCVRVKYLNPFCEVVWYAKGLHGLEEELVIDSVESFGVVYIYLDGKLPPPTSNIMKPAKNETIA